MAETNTIQKILLSLGDQPINLNVAIPGVQGKDGANGKDGRNGDDGRSAFQIAQSLGFKGTEAQWIESLKAGAIAVEARDLLLRGNIWCKSSAISDVLYAIITNLGSTFPRVGFKTLQIPTVFRGQRVVVLEGEPHYTVKVAGSDVAYEIGDNGSGSVTIEPLGVDDVSLTYHNFIGDKVGEYTIKGVADENAVHPDETYEELGSKYSKYGRKLVINVTNQKTTNNWSDDKDFNFLGKWKEADFDSIELVTNGKNKMFIYVYVKKGLPTIPIFVNKPELITFNHLASPVGNITVKIGTKDNGINTVNFVMDTLEWNGTKYINTGMDPL